jgi:molybdopterin/thiamine biosynthesis adenylyltransferase
MQDLDFSRQTCLPEVGEKGQKALGGSRALVVGAGGTGSPVIMYLASAGVGRVDVCDPDVVDLSNLHRQILHKAVGEQKAVSASSWVRDRGSWCEWSLQKLSDVREFEAVSGVPKKDYDVVLDCTDRWTSHRDVIMSSVRAGRTVVHGSIAGLLGRVMTFGPGTPCWLCLHPEKPAGTADLAPGTLGPVCGMVGSTMAMEALRILLGMPPAVLGKMMTFDASSMTVSKFETSKLDGCPGCS